MGKKIGDWFEDNVWIAERIIAIGLPLCVLNLLIALVLMIMKEMR